MKLKLTFPALFVLLFRREAMANSDAPAHGREAAIANALDPAEAIDFSEGADGWFKIAPYGVFRGKTPGRPQHVSVENARLMETEFNSVLGRLGRAFRGIPIYHGHPDVDPEVWPDDRRIGKVTKLEARADGLWGFGEWNSLGEENKKEGWWIYPSPRWDSPAAQARYTPDRLISIGLTNTPRIEDSEPVFNSQTPETKPNTDTTMNPKLIRQKLGLAPEATDEEVLAKLDTVTAAATASEATKTELATVKTEKDEMENSVTGKDREITSLREAHNNSLLDSAVTDTRITAGERPAWLARLNGSNREAEINSLKALTPKLNTKSLDLKDRREERKAGDDLREGVANAVAKLQKDEGLNYSAAWLKVKKDPQFKTYFDRTEG
jgi:phage I-like protein